MCRNLSSNSSIGDFQIEDIQELEMYPVKTEIYVEDEDDDEIVLFREEVDYV
jgi:hypothetical protein